MLLRRAVETRHFAKLLLRNAQRKMNNAIITTIASKSNKKLGINTY